MSFEHCESPHIPDLLVDSSTTSDYISFFSQEHLLTNMFLHPADFRVVSMTSSGTVIFNNDDYAGGRAEEFIVIDQDSLNTGRVAVITFKCNGDFREHAILLPWTLTPIVSERKIRGRFYEEILSIEEGYWIYDRLNKP